MPTVFIMRTSAIDPIQVTNVAADVIYQGFEVRVTNVAADVIYQGFEFLVTNVAADVIYH